MLLAELEIRHSRAVAPTRRVALGQVWLPTDPPPGYGGILLGAIVARYFKELELDVQGELLSLFDDLEADRRIVQPQLRHRFQTDIVGLDRSRHKLSGSDTEITFDLDLGRRPVPQLLGAAYAGAKAHEEARASVFDSMRRAVEWQGRLGPEFVAYIRSSNGSGPIAWRRFATDERWALQILGFTPEEPPNRAEVLTRFRSLVRESHPDHGASTAGAGQRIVELTEARRILLP